MLGNLLGRFGDDRNSGGPNADDQQLLDLVIECESLRKERAMTVRRQSQAMRAVFGMPKGKEQRWRDDEFRKGAYVGSLIIMADLGFQNWLWDGGPEVEKVGE